MPDPRPVQRQPRAFLATVRPEDGFLGGLPFVTASSARRCGCGECQRVLAAGGEPTVASDRGIRCNDLQRPSATDVVRERRRRRRLR